MSSPPCDHSTSMSSPSYDHHCHRCVPVQCWHHRILPKVTIQACRHSSLQLCLKELLDLTTRILRSNSLERWEMAEDPAEEEQVGVPFFDESVEDDTNNIVAVQPMDEWTQFRQETAKDMFNTWQASWYS
ncbi:uncharacterized protein LOC120251212 [Dioscorea cayenensis subsp. rotundata]|uniref:Uncharacterized protein LOC120251212 n=1 Tax=Dioscorea cayennensis subsp. rotundata TaxID=55577 RepID=A0AB40ALU9_DIOCR|nr:uncharacterized protein LOC120251212 [Dioscorea cayenensis subsp. rotundata]